MLLLVTSAHPALQPHRTPSLGRSCSPGIYFSTLEQTILSGMPWAASTTAFRATGHFPA
jgi:hypothetical protein